MNSLIKKKRLIVLFSVLLLLASYLVIDQVQKKGIYIGSLQNDTNRLANRIPDENDSASIIRRKLLGIKSNEWKTMPTAAKTSFWVQNEKNRLLELFDGQNFDLMILPTQEKNISIDRVSRLSFSRFIAEELRQKTTFKIMPVELTQRLLGERSYHFSDEDLLDLSSRFRIKYLVSPFFHNNSISIVVSDTKTKKVEGFFNLEPGDSYEYLELFGFIESSKIVDKIVPLIHAEKQSGEKFVSQVNLRIPETLAELTHDQNDPIKQAANLQLLAFLTPNSDEYERRRLFERSLVALKRSDQQHESYRLLKARAIYYLFRRPAAIKLLKDANDPAERAFLAYMHGNYLPQLTLTQDIENDYLKLLSVIELKQIAFEFGINSDDVKLPQDYSPAWKNLFNNTIKTNDYWYAPRNMLFFSELTGLFPKFDLIFNSSVKNKAIGGETNLRGLADTIFEGVFANYLTEYRSDLCCVYGDGVVTEYDLLKFYRNLGIGNLVKKLHKTAVYQARQKPTLDLIDEYETLFKDNHAMLYYKMLALENRVENSSAIERPNNIRKLLETSKKLAELSSGMNFFSIKAGFLINNFMVEYLASNQQQGVANYEYRPEVDYFYRANSDWPSGVKFQLYVGEFSAYDYTNTDFDLFKRHYDSARDATAKAAALEEIEKRFDGHPQKTLFLSERLIAQGDKVAAVELLTQAIKNKASSWPIYFGLGQYLIQTGLYEEGANVFLDYPEFKKPNPRNPVSVSYRAFEAGSLLFWRGIPDLAKPLYEISANLKTGSQASITSALRLEILEGNFLKAIQLAQFGARRYNSAYRYRDFFSLMSVLGGVDDAMTGFDQLSSRIIEPQIWSVVFIAHRMKGYDFEQEVAWINNQKKKPKLARLASRYVTLSGAVDRQINAEYSKGLEEISKVTPRNWESAYTFRKGDLITYFDNDLQKALQKGSIGFRAIKGVPQCPPDKDWYEWCKENFNQFIDIDRSFLNAYFHLRQKKFSKAYKTFLQHIRHFGSGRYKLETDPLVLSYFALAAAGVDKIETFELFLQERYEKKNLMPFDYLLAKSVIMASKGNSDESLMFLNQAFNTRPHTDNRAVFSYYQILELTEFLFQMTEDTRFISLGLDWAQRFRRIQPQYSWAHSFVAKYSADERKRIEATAFALYLDPNSAWLSSVQQNIKETAAKWWEKNNPFNPSKMSRGKLTQSSIQLHTRVGPT